MNFISEIAALLTAAFDWIEWPFKVAGLFYAGFLFAQGHLSKEGKAELANIILSARLAEFTHKLPPLFMLAFDRVYRPVRRVCFRKVPVEAPAFWRTAAVSSTILALLCIFILGGVLSKIGGQFGLLFAYARYGEALYFASILAGVIALIIACDYVSVTKFRTLAVRVDLGASGGGQRAAALVLMDLLASSLLYLIVASLFAVLAFQASGNVAVFFSDFSPLAPTPAECTTCRVDWSAAFQALRPDVILSKVHRGTADYMLLGFYVSLHSSVVWMMLFAFWSAVTAAIARALTYLSSKADFIKRYMTVEDAPLQYVSYVVVALVLLVTAPWAYATRATREPPSEFVSESEFVAYFPSGGSVMPDTSSWRAPLQSLARCGPRAYVEVDTYGEYGEDGGEPFSVSTERALGARAALLQIGVPATAISLKPNGERGLRIGALGGRSAARTEPSSAGDGVDQPIQRGLQLVLRCPSELSIFNKPGARGEPASDT